MKIQGGEKWINKRNKNYDMKRWQEEEKRKTKKKDLK